MVRQIKKILYCTDLSKSSIEVFEQTIALASQTGSTIIILHVIEDGSSSSSSPNRMIHLVDRAEYEKIRSENRDMVKNVLIGKQKTIPVIQEALQELCQKTNDKVCDVGRPVEISGIEVHYGNAADVITQVANATGCDLVTMGYYKKGSILKSLMGSAGKSVIRQSKIPLFLVPIEG